MELIQLLIRSMIPTRSLHAVSLVVSKSADPKCVHYSDIPLTSCLTIIQSAILSQNYCKPLMVTEPVFHIKAGRHAVVESMQQGEFLEA